MYKNQIIMKRYRSYIDIDKEILDTPEFLDQVKADIVNELIAEIVNDKSGDATLIVVNDFIDQRVTIELNTISREEYKEYMSLKKEKKIITFIEQNTNKTATKFSEL